MNDYSSFMNVSNVSSESVDTTVKVEKSDYAVMTEAIVKLGLIQKFVEADKKTYGLSQETTKALCTILGIEYTKSDI